MDQHIHCPSLRVPGFHRRLVAQVISEDSVVDVPLEVVALDKFVGRASIAVVRAVVARAPATEGAVVNAPSREVAAVVVDLVLSHLHPFADFVLVVELQPRRLLPAPGKLIPQYALMVHQPAGTVARACAVVVARNELAKQHIARRDVVAAVAACGKNIADDSSKHFDVAEQRIPCQDGSTEVGLDHPVASWGSPPQHAHVELTRSVHLRSQLDLANELWFLGNSPLLGTSDFPRCH